MLRWQRKGREIMGMIIGLSGKMGAGKDTFADLVVKRYPQFQKKSYAAKLKQMASMLTGISYMDMYDEQAKQKFLPEWGMTLREFLQKLGTDAIRNNFHPQTWLLALFCDLKPESFWIVTDCRFMNEIQKIKELNGYVVKIAGPTISSKNYLKEYFHSSEVELDNYQGWDFIVDNSVRTLESLEAQVDLFAKHFNL